MSLLDSPNVLSARNIVKVFGLARALDGVDFSLRQGEIHALLGENGAGKSTLINILRGHHQPTSGQIHLNGALIHIRSPKDATAFGIGMVHQHFLLVPVMTVLENLTLASQKARFLRNPRSTAVHIASITARLGWTLPLDSPVADLPVGTQQRVEIVKALLGDARILLFDEPTAVLAPNEIADLFEVLKQLRGEGRSIVFVTHKLGEVMDVCDRVTILRRGQLVGTVAVQDTEPTDLARRMVGTDFGETGDVRLPPLANSAESLKPVLSVADLTTSTRSIDDVALSVSSLEILPGEILGIAGVDGNGQTELFEVIAGLRRYIAREMLLPTADDERQAISFIPPDRHRLGLALELSVADNLVIDAALLPKYRRGPVLRKRALRRLATELASRFDIRASSLDMPVSALSGGNQQKIVIARALWRSPKLLIAVSPTRGLDIAATAYVHKQILDASEAGTAVLLISTELDEIDALATSVRVLYEGRLSGIHPPRLSRETIGLLMGGKLN
ncbi:MAG TPA: ABC transporter ATP-binding protein [Capsulimonadaceae bacterium]